MKQEMPSSLRPPVVTVLGHVDHGKTTLLDTIRKANVASGEHGGITQHIGAYQVEIKAQTSKTKGDEKGRVITFIDTPGHEAFSKMRSRGAAVADVAILVVAADDSVKPQTKESIDQIKAANIPMIVAINKVDLPGANIEKVKSDLAKVGVQVEGFGGDVPFQPISAKAGTGIPELLDLIVLVADLNELTNDITSPVEAVVVETRLDKGKGMVATVIVKKGILHAGEPLFSGDKQVGKVRAMFDDKGMQTRETLPSKPVEILGFTEHPPVGSVLTSVPVVSKVSASLVSQVADAMPDFLKPVAEQEQQKLTIILKTDTSGSMEAILESLDERVRVVQTGVGDITDADILGAKSSKAIVIGFNVKCPAAVAKLAQTEKVVYRVYTIIYELLEELAEVVAGLKEVLHQERELGIGIIIAEFPFEKSRIAGTKIMSGRLARGDMVKIMRKDTEIARGKIKTIRQGKNDVTKVEEGNDCGVLFDHQVDFALQDAIIAVTI